MAVKARELFLELDQGTLHPVYLLLGEDSGGKDSFLKLLREHVFQGRGESVLHSSVYFGSDTPVEHVMEDLKTYSMFDEKKLVVVKEFDKLKDAAAVLEYIKNPSSESVLVLLAAQNRVQKKIMDAVEQRGRVCIFWLMFEDESERWVRSRLKALGIEAERDALHYIIELSGTGRIELNNQISIISNYLSKGERLTFEKARDIIAQLHSSTVFELVNSLFIARASELLAIFHNLLENGEPPGKVFYFCNREIQRLWSAWCLREAGNTFKSIEQTLGLRKRDARRLQGLVQRMKLSHFIGLFSQLHLLDQSLKSSPKEVAMVQFEQFIASLGVQRKGG
jgi:DNA polymerase-3 subunit delta